MADRYLLESGAPDGLLLEDGSGVLLLEGTTDTTPTVAPALYDTQSFVSTRPRWFQPDTESFVPLASLAPVFVAPDLEDQSGQQERSTRPRWFQPDTEAWVPPSTPAFDPATVDFGWDASQDRTTPTRWLPPEGAVEDPEPPAAAFDPGGGFDWSEQPQAWINPPALTIESGAESPPPVTRLWMAARAARAYTNPAVDALWDAFGGPRPERRLLLDKTETGGGQAFGAAADGVVDHDIGWGRWISPPLAAQRLAGSVRGVGRTSEPLASDDFRAQMVARIVDHAGALRGYIYAGDTDALAQEFDTALAVRRHPRVPSIFGPIDTQDGDRIVVEYGLRSHSTSTSTASAIISGPSSVDLPDEEVASGGGASWIEFSGIVTFLAELDPATFYDTQAFIPNWPRWYQPEGSVEGIEPPAAPFDPSPYASLWQDASGQQDRIIQPVWHRPDDPQLGTPPFASTTATVAQQAGLWQDSSPQQDRSRQPVWFRPDDPSEVNYPTLPTITFASVPEQASLWIEQPYPLAGNAQRWYSQAVEPVDGPLQSWLFTTGAPSVPGTPPAVLIDATSGDVFLSIGGNFIVPAS